MKQTWKNNGHGRWSYAKRGLTANLEPMGLTVDSVARYQATVRSSGGKRHILAAEPIVGFYSARRWCEEKIEQIIALVTAPDQPRDMFEVAVHIDQCGDEAAARIWLQDRARREAKRLRLSTFRVVSEFRDYRTRGRPALVLTCHGQRERGSA